jgi:hypothetical protein
MCPPITGCSWFLHDRRNPTARVEDTDSSQRRPNTAAVVTGRASRFMLARREAPGDGCGVVVQRTTAALTSLDPTPTTALANLFDG